eukprot:1284121-Rhodomonas_salina.1
MEHCLSISYAPMLFTVIRSRWRLSLLTPSLTAFASSDVASINVVHCWESSSFVERRQVSLSIVKCCPVLSIVEYHKHC